jgi:hypothetical protein
LLEASREERTDFELNAAVVLEGRLGFIVVFSRLWGDLVGV